MESRGHNLHKQTKMNKGISLKEAIEKSETFTKEYIAEKEKKKNEIIKEACERLDKIISMNINTILTKPVSPYFDVFDILRYEKEISEMYNDFTISFSMHGNCVYIKLADKDWDWDGYGIKKEEIKNNKNIFSSILNKLKQ
jgi:hypothetical protein